MKTTMIRSLSLLGISLAMAMSVAAQEPKVKTSDKEDKYKSESLKMKDKKEESKFKSEDLKVKDEKETRKVKGKAIPMQPTKTVRTETKTGETQVRTTEHITPVATETIEPTPEPVVAEEIAAPVIPTPVKVSTHQYAAKKSTPRKHLAARKPNTGVRYITRTKVVRDTVFVPSPPEKVVSIQTEYVHDTVSLTRVDTVVKVETKNTYTGYRVPKGNFRKVKLKKDKDNNDVWMKRK